MPNFIIQRMMMKAAADVLAPPRPAVDVSALHARAAMLEAKLDENQEDYDNDRKTRKQYLASNTRLRTQLAEVEQQLGNAGRGEGPLEKLLKSPDPARAWEEIGRASCRERVCQYV